MFICLTARPLPNLQCRISTECKQLQKVCTDLWSKNLGHRIVQKFGPPFLTNTSDFMVIWLQPKPAGTGNPCFSEWLWAHYQLPTLFQCHEGNDLPKAGKVAIFEVAQLMRYGKMSLKNVTKHMYLSEYIASKQQMFDTKKKWFLMKFLPSATEPSFAIWLRNELMNIYELAPQVIPIEPVLFVKCKSIAAFYLHLPHKAPKCRQNGLYIECLGMKYLDHMAIRVFIQVRLPKQTEVAFVTSGASILPT